ncbi:MAG: TonB-dependent receptor plug domain-containing protein, partial [Myxococcota bacterium]
MWVWAVSLATASDPVDQADVDEEIVVTGTRTPHRQGEAPVAVEVIDREAIEQSGSQDVAELLEQHPGIDVTRGFLGAGVRLRGLEADHTLILVDGQRVVGRK